MFLNPYELRPLVSLLWANVYSHAPLKAVASMTDSPTSQALAVQGGYALAAAAMIPSDASISAVGGLMPSLHTAAASRRILFCPLSLDGVHDVAVPYQLSAAREPILSGASTILGPLIQAEIDRCLQERLQAQGFRTMGLYRRFRPRCRE
jgi:hypothetical protein